MSELLTVPGNLIGNWQLPPGTTVRSPVEFSPQSANVTDIGQSGAAKDTGAMLVAPTISTKATTLDIRIVDFLVLTQTTLTGVSSGDLGSVFDGATQNISRGQITLKYSDFGV